MALAKDINTPERLGVNKTLFFSDKRVELVKVFIGQLHILEVGNDTGFSDTLGDHRGTALNTPSKENLSWRGIVLFGNSSLKRRT